MDELQSVLARIHDRSSFHDKNFEDTNLIDVNQKNWCGDFPLQIAVVTNDIPAVQVLIDNGAAVDAKGEDGFTALHWATIKRNHAAIRVLLSRGANPGIKNGFGASPIDIATKSNDLESIELFKRMNRRHLMSTIPK